MTALSATNCSLGSKTLLPDEQQAEYNTLTQHILNTDYPEAQIVLNTRMGWPNEHVEIAVQDQRPIILVVDDSRVNQEAMYTLLSSDYQVKVAGNGRKSAGNLPAIPLS